MDSLFQQKRQGNSQSTVWIDFPAPGFPKDAGVQKVDETDPPAWKSFHGAVPQHTFHLPDCNCPGYPAYSRECGVCEQDAGMY